MNTRVVPTKVHGVLDYVTAPALIAAPELFRLNGNRVSALAPRVAGAAAAAYSPLTDYELGLRKILPMRAHLALDALSGGLLASLPWASGSARCGVRHWLPHALVGASEIALALTTRTEPPAARRGVARLVARVGRSPAALGAILVGLAAAAYLGRRWVLAGVATAADAIEEVADTVEDAAEDLADAARSRAGESGV